jgi:hypothetical protein
MNMPGAFAGVVKVVSLDVLVGVLLAFLGVACLKGCC